MQKRGIANGKVIYGSNTAASHGLVLRWGRCWGVQELKTKGNKMIRVTQCKIEIN